MNRKGKRIYIRFWQEEEHGLPSCPAINIVLAKTSERNVKANKETTKKTF